MYKEYRPHFLLSQFIETYWISESFNENTGTSRVFPDGCVDIIFSFNNNHPNSDLKPYQPYIVGTTTSYIELSFSGTIHMMGIRFNPGGITAFTSMPICDFTNSQVDLSLVDTILDEEFYARLPYKKTIEDKIQHLDDYFIKKLKDFRNIDRQVFAAIQVINENKGRIPIQETINQVCLSQRQLERRFMYVVGISPKVFSRIIRFKETLEQIRTQPQQSLFLTAIDCGYYDHAHLSKEFKQFTGQAPSDL